MYFLSLNKGVREGTIILLKTGRQDTVDEDMNKPLWLLPKRKK